MISAVEAERLVYRWCMDEARGTHSAQALATVYAGIYLDGARLLRVADLKVLDDVRLEWALALIKGYVNGHVQVPWARAIALVSLYELYCFDEQDPP